MNKPYFLLKFGTTANKDVTVKINNAKMSATGSSVKTCMNTLISTDPFDTGKGALSIVKQAQRISYSVREINVQ
jgi:hypothetical protein